MNCNDEVAELSIAASNLYRQAEILEATKTPRTKDAAALLRHQARQFLFSAESALKVAEGEIDADRSLQKQAQIGWDLAKEVKYSAAVLCALRDAGTLSQIAKDREMLEPTLEFYTACAIRDHFERAVKVKMVQSWKGLPTHDAGPIDDEKTVKKMLCLGVGSGVLAKKTGFDKKQIAVFTEELSVAEKLQRSIAIKARIHRAHEKMRELDFDGFRPNDIAARTGYSGTYVRLVLAGRVSLKSLHK